MVASTHLEAAFGAAAPEHFAWQTEHPVVSARERELVRAAFSPLGERVLDLGCGEGATLRHLGDPEGAVGVDLFEDKLVFARSAVPSCRFVAASATALPFPDASFDHVLVRDVIHHLDEPSLAIDECARVLVPGGRLDILEPCRNNPLIFAHGALLPAERGELRSTLTFLSRLVAPRFSVAASHRYQALPLHRIVYHPKLGASSLAESAAARAIVDGAERLAARLMPSWAWAYVHVRATRSA